MDLELRITGDGSSDELAQLQDWLDHEPDLRHHVRRAATIPGPESLGYEQWLMVAVGSGGMGTALAMALRTWFGKLHRPGLVLEMTVKTSPDGSVERTLELDLGRVNDKHLRALCEVLGIESAALQDSPDPICGGDGGGQDETDEE